MPNLRRIAAGTAVPLLLFLALEAAAASPPNPLRAIGDWLGAWGLLIFVLAGALGAIISASWWSVLTVPSACLLSVALWCALRGCEGAHDDPLVFGFVILGVPVALGALAGVLLTRMLR